MAAAITVVSNEAQIPSLQIAPLKVSIPSEFLSSVLDLDNKFDPNTYWYILPIFLQLFRANFDRYSLVENPINPAINARYVRINPRSWHSHISMRVELYGCKAGEYVRLISTFLFTELFYWWWFICKKLWSQAIQAQMKYFFQTVTASTSTTLHWFASKSTILQIQHSFTCFKKTNLCGSARTVLERFLNYEHTYLLFRLPGNHTTTNRRSCPVQSPRNIQGSLTLSIFCQSAQTERNCDSCQLEG